MSEKKGFFKRLVEGLTEDQEQHCYGNRFDFQKLFQH